MTLSSLLLTFAVCC